MVKGVHHRKFTVPVHITARMGVTTCTHTVVLRHAEILLSGYGDSPGITNNNKLLEYCSLVKERPWPEHLTSLPKRGDGHSFECFCI